MVPTAYYSYPLPFSNLKFLPQIFRFLPLEKKDDIYRTTFTLCIRTAGQSRLGQETKERRRQVRLESKLSDTTNSKKKTI